MKFLQLLIFVCFSFVSGASAQLCGVYKTTLKVTRETGQPIANAQVKISPLQKKDDTRGNKFEQEKKDSSRFTITFNEGHEVGGKYKVVVSAPDFSSAEKEFTFPHCAGRVFEVVLKPKSAKSKSEIRDLIKINGEIFGAKNRLAFVELTITDGAGKIRQIKTDETGYFSLELPLGDYTIMFQKAGYKLLKLINVEIKERKKLYLSSINMETARIGEEDDIVVKDFKDLNKSKAIYQPPIIYLDLSISLQNC